MWDKIKDFVEIILSSNRILCSGSVVEMKPTPNYTVLLFRMIIPCNKKYSLHCSNFKDIVICYTFDGTLFIKCFFLTLSFLCSWVFGEFLCKMYQFVHALSYTASIFILMVICMERYFAIIYPITCKQILTTTRLRVSK